jgi:Peptidase inhibitor I78 family
MHGASVVLVPDTSRNETEWVTRYAGLALPEALELAAQEGRATRVLRPGDAMTLDWRPDRLNLHVDDDGELVEARAG